jgi:hypothetical protein
VSLFTFLLNLTILKFPDAQTMQELAKAHKHSVNYYIDLGSDGLDEYFYRGACNISFV